MSKKQYSIVGQKHRGKDPYLTGTLPGTPAVLVREPPNPYDPNAIAVYIGGDHVGYIPSKQNAVLAQFIDQNGHDFGVDVMAMDGVRIVQRKAIDATFIRSPNSAYPMVEV